MLNGLCFAARSDKIFTEFKISRKAAFYFAAAAVFRDY